MSRLIQLLAAVCALGCGSSPGSALRVTLDFAPSSALCGKVKVTGKVSLETSALARGAQPAVVGVVLTQALGSSVSVEAFGWPTADCTGSLVAAARPADVFFPAQGVTEVPLVMTDLGADGGTGGGGGADGGGGSGGHDGGTDGGGADAGGPDAGGLDAGRVEFPFTPANFDPQLSPALTAGDVVLDCGVSAYDSRTNAFDNWCGRPTPTPVVVSRALSEDVVVLAMRGFTLAGGSTLKLTGDKAVILAVYGDADVQGLVDADAEKEVPGPGGSKSFYCPISTGAPGVYLSGAGGGGAGHYSVGSAGGDGPVTPTFGVGGSSVGLTFPVPLRGGCSGGPGAVRSGADSQAPGGGGGGALQLSVANRLRVSGRLSVAGGGGRGASAYRGGGGGGGSGGGLHLEAQTLVLAGSAKLLANGGGGGGAAENNAAGQDGQDGRNDSTSRANGGSEGGGQAGQGGDGESFAGSDTEGESASGNNGGGGGGGAAAGRIHLRGVGSCSKGGSVEVSPAFTGACP